MDNDSQIIGSVEPFSIDSFSNPDIFRSWACSEDDFLEFTREAIPSKSDCASQELGEDERSESLDLILEHLSTTSSIFNPIELSPGFSPPGWFSSPELPKGFASDGKTKYVLKVQPFKSGGYEAVCSNYDIDPFLNFERICSQGGGGSSSPISVPNVGATESLKSLGFSPSEVVLSSPRVDTGNVESILKSIARSKVRVRHLIASIGCDRLLTLTVRTVCSDDILTREQFLAAWKRFLRLVKKAGANFEYVAVLEKHKSGQFHLHAAIKGKCNIKLIRKCWHLALGARSDNLSPGNVDIKFRTDLTPSQRVRGMAKYLSKYLTKQSENVEFNDKRYFSSRHKLPPVERIVFSGDSLLDVIAQFAKCFGLSLTSLLKHKGIFIFPEDRGFWYFHDDRNLEPVPF